MTPEQIDNVQRTWNQVAPIAEQAAELFYNKLFELEPGYRSLFSGDMKSQGRKLMTMIGTAVSSLTKLESILPAVEDLGVRHLDYGVQARDYDVVGEALLWTLNTGLGDEFTPEVEEAWAETYSTLASVMIDAAAKAEQTVA